MELLAPAGSMDKFMAALEAGADAVYMGGKGFNARAHAANFDMQELEEAVRLAHILQVSVYVTVNILIGDSEMKALERYLQDLEKIGVDAIIVQDLAVAELARRVAPKLHLHGSTQMTAATLDGVRFYEALGFSRVVLARELSLKEIEHICANCRAEIEVFVHGALCVCYSGQCLMSSFIGGRSGNRGDCAQPCRLPYELIDGGGNSILPDHEAYLLSPKDLNYSEHMDELVRAGVTSFKVEGRMKQVSYVRQVIGTYRKILDTAVCDDRAARALSKSFNRGFSTAYLNDTVGKEMMSVVAPNHQGKPLIKDSQKTGLQDFTRKYGVYAYLGIADYGGENRTELIFMLEDGTAVTSVHDYVPTFANREPTSVERVREQLGRLGNTLFRLEGVQIPDGPYMWPSSVLNALRRDGIQQLEEALISRHMANRSYTVTAHYNICDLSVSERIDYGRDPLISVRADEVEGVAAAIRSGAKKVIFGGDRLQRHPYGPSVYEKVCHLCKAYDVICSIATPRVLKDDETDSYMEELVRIVKANPHSISIHVPQALLWLRRVGYTGAVEADTGLNIFNTPSAVFWQTLGVSSIAPSQELTLQQLHRIASACAVPVEAAVHGFTEMMISEYCTIASFGGTGLKHNCPMPCTKERYFLKDRKGELFPLRTDPYCRMHIMNSHELDMRAYVPELLQKGMHILRIDARQTDPERIAFLVKAYRSIMDGTQRPPEKAIGKDAPSVTRGHYFRGIL